MFYLTFIGLAAAAVVARVDQGVEAVRQGIMSMPTVALQPRTTPDPFANISPADLLTGPPPISTPCTSDSG